MYSIRSVTPDDCVLLRNLAKHCEPLDLHTHYTYWILCSQFSKQCFILLFDDKPAGFITSVTGNGRVFVWQIGLLPEYRGKGLSEKLISSVFSFAQSKGMNLGVSIDEQNKASYNSFNKYCKKFGYSFTPSGKLTISDECDSGTKFFEQEIIYEMDKLC